MLAESGNQEVDDIKSLIPDDQARYHVFLYRHNHEGDSLESYGMLAQPRHSALPLGP